MKREAATALLRRMLGNLDAGQDEWPLHRLEKLYVFGSYARGSLQPHDVDVTYTLRPNHDPAWTRHVVNSFANGKDPAAILRVALRGRTPNCSPVDDSMVDGEIPRTVLWQRGEALEVALGRLQAIAADPAAGRAPRDDMLPVFVGIERWTSMANREVAAAAVQTGALSIERLVLPRVEPDVFHTDLVLRLRWKATSPLRAAAGAALANLLHRSVDIRGVELHNQLVGRPAPYNGYAVYLGMRDFNTIPRTLNETSTTEVLIVIRSQQRDTFDSLRITVADPVALTRLVADNPLWE
jgi:hypothetical protein